MISAGRPSPRGVVTAALLAAVFLSLVPGLADGSTHRSRRTVSRTGNASVTHGKTATVATKSKKKPVRKARSKKSKKSTKTKKAAASPPAISRQPDPNRVTFSSADGVELVGTWLPATGQPDAPAVLLVHAFSRDRREWEPFQAALRGRGLSILAIDLRGHGESTRKKGRSISVTPGLLRSPQAFPRDVEAACRWLKERTRQIGVFGWQVGANLAVLASANGWADVAVAISASTSNLAEIAGGRATRPRKTLLIASAGDPGREASAQSLHKDGVEPKKLIIYSGAAHARALLESNKAALDESIAWLADGLGAIPPPPHPSSPPLVTIPSVSGSSLLPPPVDPSPAPTPQAP
jgi:pimeloyl-ACP methyl ester carboxylesterase